MMNRDHLFVILGFCIAKLNQNLIINFLISLKYQDLIPSFQDKRTTAGKLFLQKTLQNILNWSQVIQKGQGA